MSELASESSAPCSDDLKAQGMSELASESSAPCSDDLKAQGMSVEALNEFTRTYYAGLGTSVYADPVPISAQDTALVLIDIQECITKDYYVQSLTAMGVDTEPLLGVLDLMQENIQQALDNIERLLAACREKAIAPIHVRIQSYQADGRDTGALHASAGMIYPPGSPAVGFLPQAAPKDGEVVLQKTCSGIHVGTHIDQVLRNMGIRNVIVVGFYTDQCISTSVRDLSDLGYRVDLISDAVGAMSPERHRNAMESIQKIYANSETTEELLNRLKEL